MLNSGGDPGSGVSAVNQIGIQSSQLAVATAASGYVKRVAKNLVSEVL
jgi:hypothetical protein